MTTTTTGIVNPLGAIRVVLRARPTCEHRITGRRWCPRIATTAIPVKAGSSPLRNLSPRCRQHAPLGAVRLCLQCRGPNGSGDEWLCSSCQRGPEDER
jgi:hypothetical protein